MNFYAFSALIVCLSSVASGAFVFWKNPRGQKNIFFQFVVFPIALWAFFYILWQMSDNAVDALFYIRIAVAFAVLNPVTLFHGLIKILDAETPRRMIFVKFFYVLTLSLILFTFSSYDIP